MAGFDPVELGLDSGSSPEWRGRRWPEEPNIRHPGRHRVREVAMIRDP